MAVVSFVISPVVRRTRNPTRLALVVFRYREDYSARGVRFVICGELGYFAEVLGLQFNGTCVAYRLVVLVRDVSWVDGAVYSIGVQV